MSTRCQIQFKDADGMLRQVYRHSDGYPDGKDGVIADLMRLRDTLKKHRAYRGADYLAAQFLFLDKVRLWEKYPLSALLGHGVEDADGSIHGDEEYLYQVHILNEDGLEWTVRVTDHNGFLRWDDVTTKKSFNEARWQFDGSLDKAVEKFAAM